MKKLFQKIRNKWHADITSSINEKTDKIISLQKATIHSNIFINSIQNCEWVSDKKFYPGRWAVDFSFLCTLFRVLNETKPKKILEFGLGQSSKLVHQYANFYENVEAVTGEHDKEWADFIKKSMPYSVNIKFLELEKRFYKGFETLSYKNIKNEFKNQKFNLIVIDAPFGQSHYSRSQILELLPDILEDSFCIILDDYNRTGEKETAQEMMNILNENNIKYFSAIYAGNKQHFLLCSENVRFLTTMQII